MFNLEEQKVETEMETEQEVERGVASINLLELLNVDEVLKPKDSVPKKERPVEVQIVDSILRNDDFGYGFRRERTLEFLQRALEKEPSELKELCERINKELLRRGSSMKLTVAMAVQEVDGRPNASLRWPYRDVVLYEGATLELVNKYGEVEDRSTVLGKPLKDSRVEWVRAPETGVYRPKYNGRP